LLPFWTAAAWSHWPAFSQRLLRKNRVSAAIGNAPRNEIEGVDATGQNLAYLHFEDEPLQQPQRVLEEIYGIEFFEASEHSGEGVRFRKR
jgi:hypothetical protein